MGGLHRAAPQVHRRGDDPVRAQKLHQPADAGDIRHRVQGPHLVEVDLFDGRAVGPALRRRQEAVDLLGLLPHRGGQAEAVDHPVDIGQGPVLVLVVVVDMAVVMLLFAAVVVFMAVVVVVLVALLPAVDVDAHMGARHALPGGGLRLHAERRVQAVHARQERLLVRQELVQGPHEHIPRRAHGALEI